MHRYKNPEGERLARILTDLGYGSARNGGGAIAVGRACDVVNRHLTGDRRVTPNMLLGYLYQGKEISLRVSALLAMHLGFTLEELAYETRMVPFAAARRVTRKPRGVLDEVESLKWG